jgi:hypothetical protein
MSNENQAIKFRKPHTEDVIKWWQWVTSIPLENDKKHPFLQGGETNQNQPENFICLACVGRKGGEDHDRKITIPAGKDILVPVFVASYSTIELPNRSSAALLQQCSRETEKPKNLEFRVDNIIIDPYYLKTDKAFQLDHPNVCTSDLPKGVDPGKYDAMSAGYWCKVSLPKREKPYTIRFGGTTDIDIGQGPIEFNTKVTYQVSVN